MTLGWLISTVVVVILGNVFAIFIATLNKKVVKDSQGKIDFKKTDIYFQWTRWDNINIVVAGYTYLCLIGLCIVLLRGDNIESPWVQFFLHQTAIFSLLTIIWLISRIVYVLKGIKKRWPDEFE